MIFIYKPLGLSPLEAINRLKIQKPELKDCTLSYAGRLDPMAEGLLLVLVDEENKSRRKLEHFDKEYEFEAIIGIRTDSFDLLGIPQISHDTEWDEKVVYDFISKNSKKLTHTYPIYSSIKVDGKPLYWWARQKREVKIPQKTIDIHKFELIGSAKISKTQLLNDVVERISRVSGDFRQEEILSNWHKEVEKSQLENFDMLKFKFACSSGGYVRSAVNDLGKALGVGAVTYSIKRTAIGDVEVMSKNVIFIT